MQLWQLVQLILGEIFYLALTTRWGLEICRGHLKFCKAERNAVHSFKVLNSGAGQPEA
jgi:hypothetical protein